MSTITVSPVEEVAAQSPLKMSYEEFLAWANEDTHAEWVNGEVIIHMPPKLPHQTLVTFLDRLLGVYIAFHNLGELRTAPFEVKLQPDGPSREPDLMFVARANLHRLTENRIAGVPDLVIEVVSQDSVHRDRVDKFDEYEMAGVPEYWILDNRPRRKWAQFYKLNAQGQYQKISVSPDGIFHSEVVPGFWLRLEWLWVEQPNLLRALAELIGPDEMSRVLRLALQD